jgi:hypothetical protein
MGAFEKKIGDILNNPERWAQNEEWYEFTPLSVQTCRSREQSAKKENAVKMAYFGAEIGKDGLAVSTKKGVLVSDEIAQLMTLFGI